MNKFLIVLVLALNVYCLQCLDSYHDTMIRAAQEFQGQSKARNLPDFFETVDLENKQRQMMDELREFFTNVDFGDDQFPNISGGCLIQFSNLSTALSEREQWALTVLDSFSKPPSGLLGGITAWQGNYLECVQSSTNKKIGWEGQYCKTNFKQKIPIFGSLPQLSLCMPSKCSEHEIAELVYYVNITQYVNLNVNFTDANISCMKPAEIDEAAVFAIFVLSVLVILAIMGTFYDLYKQHLKSKSKKEHYSANPLEKAEDDINGIARERKASVNGETNHKDEKFEYTKLEDLQKSNSTMLTKLSPKFKSLEESTFLKVILCFSLYTNLKKLFTISTSADQMGCINGIRFLSMGWVVLGHTFAFSVSFIVNPVEAQSWLMRFTMLVVSNAFFSVDSFFLLSGLLGSYIFMKEMKKRDGQLSWSFFLKYYIHRFWRLTPPYALCIMVTACLTRYFAVGPNYPSDTGLDPNCRSKWYWNLLYLNNIVDSDHMCFGIAWYLANDMQFHWIAPIILIPFVWGLKKRLFEFIGYGISAFMLALNILVVALVLNSKPGSERGTFAIDEEVSGWYMKHVYFTPWCRIGAFIVGILTGYAIFKSRSNPNFKLSHFANMICWYVSIFSMGLMLFGVWPNFDYYNPANFLTKTQNILYQSTSRIIWCMGLGFIIFSCVNNRGGFVNDILCWKVWIPLSRLSFCAYLVHLNVLYWSLSQRYSLFYWQEINVVYQYIGHMVFSYMVSLVASMLFEVPMLGLEKIVFKRK